MTEVQNALLSISSTVPVSRGLWQPTATNQKTPDQYIIYSTMTNEVAHSDDKCIEERTFVYMNLWSKTDPSTTAAQVRTLMRQAGFAMQDETDQGYNQTAYDYKTREFCIIWTWVYRRFYNAAQT